MKFQLFHNKFFDAQTGSYSLVTDREEYDSQITLTDFEADIVINYFGSKNIHVGNVASNTSKSSKMFLLFPSLSQVKLNLVFPKPNKHELRLYISSRAGFKPKSGEIWFLFINRKNHLVIGSLPAKVWNDLDQADPEDNNYQLEIESTIAGKGIVKSTPVGKIVLSASSGGSPKYLRNPLIAAVCLSNAKFVCEIDSSHKTFIAQKSNTPFVEAHHFVPMKFQGDFPIPLDCVENVISLCPNCHRGIHLGIVDYKKNLVENIYKKRGTINKFKLDDIYSFYNLLTP